jgi:hypothetical protein
MRAFKPTLRHHKFYLEFLFITEMFWKNHQSLVETPKIISDRFQHKGMKGGDGGGGEGLVSCVVLL